MKASLRALSSSCCQSCKSMFGCYFAMSIGFLILLRNSVINIAKTVWTCHIFQFVFQAQKPFVSSQRYRDCLCLAGVIHIFSRTVFGWLLCQRRKNGKDIKPKKMTVMEPSAKKTRVYDSQKDQSAETSTCITVQLTEQNP